MPIKITILLSTVLLWLTAGCFVGLLSVLIGANRIWTLVRAVDYLCGQLIIHIILGTRKIPLKKVIWRKQTVSNILQTGSARFIISPVRDAVDKLAWDDQVHGGDLIVSNHQSPLDLIYLQSMFSPKYILQCIAHDGSISLRSVGFLRALFMCGKISRGSYSQSKKLHDCINESKSNFKPLVFFPEGNSTNGRGLMRSLVESKGLDPNQRVHLFSLSYVPASCFNLPVGGIWEYFKLICNIFKLWLRIDVFDTMHVLSVKWMPASSLFMSEAIVSTENEKFINEGAMSTISAMTVPRRPQLSLSILDKERFLITRSGRYFS